MSTQHLLDPEILPVLEALPTAILTEELVPVIRTMSQKAMRLVKTDGLDVVREEVLIAGLTDDAPQIRCLLYKPKKIRSQMGAYLHFHAGGFILGSPEMSDQQNISICSKLGIIVLSVDYRLTPEFPAPAALDDTYAALSWLHDNVSPLNIDATRIAVGGESAGGGLAASLVLRAAQSGQYPICHQFLTYPMLDSRTGSHKCKADPLVGEFVWTRQNNQFGWSCYLGGAKPQAPQVPALAEDLSGLPASWIATGALDLFRDENIVYAQRLLRAGVSTEMIIYPGTCHGFQMAEEAKVSQRYFLDLTQALDRALN